MLNCAGLLDTVVAGRRDFRMFSVVWVLVVVAPVALLVIGLRWLLTDLLLDRFEWPSDGWKARTPRRAPAIGSTRRETSRVDAKPL
jgi:hypothetical protein